MSIAILFYIVIALWFSFGSRRHQKSILGVWAGTFSILATYTLWSHSYIQNPLSDYFINIDQLLFYKESLALSRLDIENLFSKCFLQFRYSESPLAFALFATLVKWAQALGVSDLLLFVKLNVVFIASLIPVLIYRIINLYRPPSKQDLQAIFLFVLCSPLLSLAGQMMRDIHVCFLYTCIFFFSLRNHKYDWLLILLLIVATYFFRVESGLFALSFLVVLSFRHFQSGSPLTKALFALVGIMAIGLILPILLNTMTQTLDGYTARSLKFASKDSLGAQLTHLPFPLDALSKMAFAQLLPFPLWLPISGRQSYDVLRVVECVMPFFWLPIFLTTIWILWTRRDKMTREHLHYAILALLFLFLTSASEFNPRRLFAIYPVFICLWILYSDLIRKREKYYIYTYTYLGIICLNILYLAIK